MNHNYMEIDHILHFCKIKSSTKIKIHNLNANIQRLCTFHTKICIIEVYLLKYYFESHLIYKWRYFRQTIFNQLNIMASYVDINGLCHSIPILWWIYVMRPKCRVRCLRFHFKRMTIMGLGDRLFFFIKL